MENTNWVVFYLILFVFCIVKQAEERLCDTKVRFFSANSAPETSTVMPTTQSRLSCYLASAVLVWSHTIDVVLPVMETAYSYATMLLSVVNKVHVWGYTLWLVYSDQTVSGPGKPGHDNKI